MATVRERQAYVYVSSCLQGDYDISIVTIKSRRQRKLLTNILDKWMEHGYISDYRISNGRSVTDAFGTHGHKVKLMVEFFTGYDKPEREHREIRYEPKLPMLPERDDDRLLDHRYQGEKIPYQYSMIERMMADKKAEQEYRAQGNGRRLFYRCSRS